MPNSFSLPANNTVSTLCSSGTSPDLKKLWHGISIFSKWRKCGPFYHISQLSKAFGDNNLVIILAGLVSVGTYIQYIGATFCRITWTRFLIQSFQTYLIHHSKIRKFDGNLQNTFRTFSNPATAFFTDTVNLDNKTQANNSNLGTIVSFTGTTQHFPVLKLTLAPCLQTLLTTPPLFKPHLMHHQIHVGLRQAYHNTEPVC